MTATWPFRTEDPDVDGPEISTLNPANGATDVTPNGIVLQATFNENIVANAAGAVVISNRSTSATDSIPMSDGQIEHYRPRRPGSLPALPVMGGAQDPASVGGREKGAPPGGIGGGVQGQDRHL